MAHPCQAPWNYSKSSSGMYHWKSYLGASFLAQILHQSSFIEIPRKGAKKKVYQSTKREHSLSMSKKYLFIEFIPCFFSLKGI